MSDRPATSAVETAEAAEAVPNPVIRLDGVDLRPGAVGGDPRLDDHRSLTDAQLRRRRDAEEGMYLAESPLVVRRAVAAGHRVRSFLLAAERLADLVDVVAARPEAPVFLGDEEQLRSLTGFRLHRGVLAAMERPREAAVDEVVDGARTLLVLDGLADHVNLGAVARTAAGLGVDGMLLSPGCADPLYRRSVRVSMGAVLTMPWARLPRDAGGGWATAAAGLRAEGITLVALEQSETSRPLTDPRIGAAERLALVLGTEGPGVSAAALAAADHHTSIPMAESAGLDSLNVAAAAAVACWELGRRPGLG